MNDGVTLWWIAIALAVVVTAVVAVLLALIVRTAAGIEGAVAEVWARGQQVANNTIHIPALYRTRDAVTDIHESAGRILGHAEAIAAHAADCPGCPSCILKSSS